MHKTGLHDTVDDLRVCVLYLAEKLFQTFARLGFQSLPQLFELYRLANVAYDSNNEVHEVKSVVQSSEAELSPDTNLG